MFALAGLAAAAVPVVLHLFHRQRYRTIDWAAMDFLREAIERSRRARLRDVLLLALRVACLALFGLAMARPFFASAAHAPLGNQPVHAILLVDNSLSMAYRQLDGSLLDTARRRARELIEQLPAGSRISVLPVCATEGTFSRDSYATADDALDALDAIRVADRQLNLTAAVELALDTAQRTAEPAAKRFVLFSDGQAINWPAEAASSDVRRLENLQFVEVSPHGTENAWIADFRLADGVADVQGPARLLARVRYEGAVPRRSVEITLSVDGQAVDSRTIDLLPGQAREVALSHRFQTAVENGQVAMAKATVALASDRLSDDDTRSLIVPVVAALPVVFVDQYGDGEDPARGQYGETYRLRRLLRSAGSADPHARPLVQVRHLRIDELSADALDGAWFVVLAGVETPGDAVSLLRQYVDRGGQLIIAAGAEFDPVAWNAAAWLDGKGVLPAPLEPELIGARPRESVKLEPFAIDPSSLAGSLFDLDGIANDERDELFREPLFFQAVRVAERADSQLRVLARFTNHSPLFVDREIGRGRVTFIASAVQSDWNTLTMTNAVLLFDRMFRLAIERSLPRRTLGPLETFSLPIDAHDRRGRFTLVRPDGTNDPLTVDAIGNDTYRLRLHDLSQRGIYHVVAERGEAQLAADNRLADIPLAVNGPERESELRPLDAQQWAERLGDAPIRRLASDEAISIDGGDAASQNLWKWLMATVLAGLLVETAVLAVPRREERATP
ncbi:MAG TPA: BatA domain-containing protein [Pirellulales bacterium]|nr:BatA domain-containing protein [Pirellulales bacterium]